MRRTSVALLLVVSTFLSIGLVGAFRYADGFWVYRGFPPPTVPRMALGSASGRPTRTPRGTVRRILVASPALGGARQLVYVYLPPGYAANPARRYPVAYILHGTPGNPLGLLNVAQVGVTQDILVAQQRMAPMIEVMPTGSTSFFKDEEWADGAAANSHWETFLARDVVGAIDGRFRTIHSGAGRAIMGLSEGGYGALNIGFHHAGEFRVMESWSGYDLAIDVKAVFAGDRRLLAYNSPMLTAPVAAWSLRATHAYVWFYTGSDDRELAQNIAFARELAGLHIAHTFFLGSGGHTWALWRRYVAQALIVASEHMVRG